MFQTTGVSLDERSLSTLDLNGVGRCVLPTAEGIVYTQISERVKGNPYKLDAALRSTLGDKNSNFQFLGPYSEASWLHLLYCRTYVGELLIGNTESDFDIGMPGWELILERDGKQKYPDAKGWRTVSEPQEFDVVAYAKAQPVQQAALDLLQFEIGHFGFWVKGMCISKRNMENAYCHALGAIIDEPARVFFFRHPMMAHPLERDVSIKFGPSVQAYRKALFS